MKKYALMMDMPEGKLPGFYAQIVKALANKILLFDRDKELLIINTDAERELVSEVMQKYHIQYENVTLVLLPENSSLTPQAEDYGFTSRSGNIFFYDHLVSVFHFVDNNHPDNDAAQALLQMEEHIIARYSENGTVFYAVDKQLEGLIHGIAKAYHCEVYFIKH